MTKKNNPLLVGLVDGELIIHVGVNTFCDAVQMKDAGWDTTFAISNEIGFCWDIVNELEQEDERGTTRLQALFDELSQKVSEWSDHIFFTDNNS